MSAKILILEDDPQLRTILGQVLGHQGYDVKTAENGSDAVKLAMDEDFDLIIADIRMDGMDGLEAVRLTKEKQPEIGSLIVSGYASEEETSRAEQIQVGGYLKKPFKTNELLKRVRKLLSEKTSAAHRQDKGDSDRQSMVWALEQALRYADISGEAGPESWLSSVMKTTRQLGAEMGMVEQVSHELSLGAGLMALSRASGEKLPEEVSLSSHLSTFKVLFRDGKGDDSLPLESALVDLAVTASEIQRDKNQMPTAEHLEEKFSGRYTAPLLAAYGRVITQAAEEPSKPVVQETVAPSRAGVSAYSLAQALERGGDYEGAERAYLHLAEEGKESPTTVRAMLGAGRLAQLRGRPKDAVSIVEKAHKLAPRFGPTLNALSGLEWGLLLSSTKKKKEAAEILTSAVTYLESLGLWNNWSRGQLALAELGTDLPSATIKRLMKFAVIPGSFLAGEHLGQTLPTLLKLYEKGAIEDPSAFSMILQSSPKRLESLLPGLSDNNRVSLIKALTKADRPCPEEFIRVLQADPSSDVRKLAEGLTTSSSDPVASEALRIFSLGVFQVFRGEERVSDAEFKTQKNRYLLAYLAADRGRPKPAEALIEQFWPDKGERGRYSLNWSVSILRSLFRSAKSNVIIREGDKLFLDPKAPRWHDLDELEDALRLARKADSENDTTKAWQYYRRTAELYRGGYLEGCYFDWALSRQTKVSNVLAESFMRLAQICDDAKQYAEALSAVTQLLELRPHSQKAHLLKMQLHTKNGAPEAAVAHYRRCEELLRVEYELEPSTDIIRAYHEARLSL